ncbi:alkaline shock response membrane anchor protein AmaP [Streptomyces sp. NPDC050315]|uniref:alkaline shock response membrane anchor protein AmaP n=1 Tax=Streptomyces sp. NPDC050315 TaxID=3155039 RepID=UPI003423E2F0
MRQVRRAVNRVLLGLTGLVLLGAGGLVLFGGALPREWHSGLPDGWPWAAPGDVLLPAAERTRWTGTGWWWPVVLGALGVLVLLALWWLLTQFRGRRLREVLVDTGDGEGALLRGRALEDVLAAEAASADGVHRAVAHLTGRRREPRVRVRLLLEPHADPAGAVDLLGTQAVAHARESTGLPELPAEVRLRAVRHRAERVS